MTTTRIHIRPPEAAILLVAQYESEIEPVREFLTGKQYDVRVRFDMRSTEAVSELDIAHVCMVDMRLTDQDGRPLYRWVREQTDGDVIGLCERSDLGQAVQEVNRGVLYDYLILTPIYDIHQYEFTVRRALQKQRLDETVQTLMDELDRFRSQYLPNRLDESREYVRQKLDRHLDRFMQSLAAEDQDAVKVQDQQGLQQMFADFKHQQMGEAINDLKTQLYEDLYLQVESAQTQFQAQLAEEDEGERNKPVILVVDDEEKVRKNVAAVLSTTKYEVAMAESGEQALKMARMSPPDLILMDVAMPGMNGTDTVKKMKEEKPLREVPVIMLTAIATQSTVYEALESGVVDYIVKPFRSATLLERIESYIQLMEKERESG